MKTISDTSRLTVLCGGPGTGKTASLIDRYARLAPDEQRRALFVTVSRPAARELERRLRESFGDPVPPVWTLPSLPLEILRAAGLPPARTLTETDRQRLIAWLLVQEAAKEDAPDRLKSWTTSRRAVAMDLSAAVGLLQRHRVPSGELQVFAETATNSAHLLAIARMVAVYQEALAASGATDFDGLTGRALQALEAQHRPSLPDILFVDEAQELDALQARLVAALAGPGGRVAVAADAVQRTQMYRGAVHDVAAALSAAMEETAQVVACDGEGLDGAVTSLAAGFGFPSVSARPVTLGHIVARNPEDEAGRIAKEVRKMSGRRAVLTRSNRAAMILQDALRKEGITVAAGRVASTHAQRFLRDALTVLGDVRHDDEDGRASRLRSGLRLLASSDAPDEEVLRARKDYDKHPDGPLPDRVRGWVDAAQGMGSLAARVHWLCTVSRWLQRLPGADRDAAARAYSTAMVSLMGLEETWRTATGEPSALPPAEALIDLRGILLAALYPDAEPSPAPEDEDADHGRADLVDVLPVHQAAGRHWDHVILSELQDGGFPQYPTPSPFIPEDAASEVRAWLEKREGRPIALGRFERRADVTVEEERRLFLTALSRATQSVTLSCHVQEADHPVAPSWFFQSTLPAGTALHADAPESFRCLLRDTLPRTSDGIRDCEACPLERCSGRTDGTAAAPPVLEPAVPSGDSPPTVTGAPALGPEWRLSATALNTYYTCPRKFFLAHALRLSDVEADTMAAGTALHAIVERYNKAVPPRTWDILEEAMKEVFADSRPGNRFSSVAAWRLAQRKIRRALEIFWQRTQDRDADAMWVEEWLNFHLEDSSGTGHGFAGQVDLATRRDSGIVLVDFKSSRPPKTVSDLRKKLPAMNGSGDVEVPDEADVQLALYAAGASAIGQNPVAVAHEYITVSRPGEGARVEIPIVPRADPRAGGKNVLIREDLEAFARFFGDTAHTIKETSGFAATPASGECEAYHAACPFSGVCDRERDNT